VDHHLLSPLRRLARIRPLSTQPRVGAPRRSIDNAGTADVVNQRSFLPEAADIVTHPAQHEVQKTRLGRQRAFLSTRESICRPSTVPAPPSECKSLRHGSVPRGCCLAGGAWCHGAAGRGCCVLRAHLVMQTRGRRRGTPSHASPQRLAADLLRSNRARASTHPFSTSTSPFPHGPRRVRVEASRARACQARNCARRLSGPRPHHQRGGTR
jgi:hypothetical protein